MKRDLHNPCPPHRNFDAKRTPEANLLLNGEVSHKKTLTEVEVKIRHGQNVKLRADKSKELVVAGFVAHNIKQPKATVRFDLKAVYPDKVSAGVFKLNPQTVLAAYCLHVPCNSQVGHQKEGLLASL